MEPLNQRHPSDCAKAEMDAWFVREVLPLEGLVLAVIRRHWHDPSEITDLRQDVFVRIYEAGRGNRPDSTKAFVLAIVRNLLIDKARRARVVSIEAMSELESLDIASLDPSPEQHACARQELHMLEQALDALPPRCREVVELRKIEGLSQREVALRMGISEETVQKQIMKGVRAMATSLCKMGADLSFKPGGRRSGGSDEES
ncbi:MAG TPA: RNA polymerase sigma factor [Albitalea sp.]|uniref:RNA polymerase sigma factor n=1 Tax=Piscinibacter sp. TaxID=1903157 RepID=UPI002ED39C9A